MRPLDAAAKRELRALRHDVRELRHVWHGEVMHALGELREPQPVDRVTARMPWIKAKHAAMQDGLRESVGRVALVEFLLRLEDLLAVASDEAEPFLRVLPEKLSALGELGELLETKAATIGFDALRAQPYVEAVREVVRVYRESVGVVLVPESSVRALPEHSP